MILGEAIHPANSHSTPFLSPAHDSFEERTMRFWMKALGLSVLGCISMLAATAQQPAATGQAQPAPGTPTAGQAGSQANGQNQGNNAPRFDAARFLKDHDKNKDGKLSKDELPMVTEKEFNEIDSNHDGFITQQELQNHADLMARQRPQLVEVILYAIDVPEEPLNINEVQAAYDELRKLDKNHDGKIDENELKAYRDQRRKERIDAIFNALDRNKDGKIEKDEARGIWADNFDKLDKNHDGVLERSEVEAAASTEPGNKTNNNQPNNKQPNK
jgi:Ca2+-binding EF-hand superfamily protein